MIQNKGNSKVFRGLSGFDLKCLAMLSMVIDHIGCICFPNEIWMRCIGRLAMPIYCFLLVEGYIYTKNFWRYFGRMMVFALISEVPYDIAFRGSFWDINHQNIFFTLASGLLCIHLLNKSNQSIWNIGVIAGICGFMHHFLKSDYELMGIGIILAYYILHKYKLAKHLVVGAINFCQVGTVQFLGAAAAFPLLFYNGEKGPSAKYVFYWFYPVHLLLIYYIWRFVLYVG